MPQTILVADDEKHIRRLLQVNLERAGYAVLTAGDGKQALAVLAEQDVDLVVLDWMMPRLNGLEALVRLRQNAVTESLPVLMLTAKAGDWDVLKVLGSGAECSLTKPFNPMELLTIIKRMIGGPDGPDPPDVAMQRIA